MFSTATVKSIRAEAAKMLGLSEDEIGLHRSLIENIIAEHLEKAADAKTNSHAAKARKSTHLQMQEKKLKKLKSYVSKCGVRKIWKKELEGLDISTSISKVQSILNDLGVDGRPSIKKCVGVKKQRAHQSELLAIDRSNILKTRLRKECAPASHDFAPSASSKLDLRAFGDPED